MRLAGDGLGGGLLLTRPQWMLEQSLREKPAPSFRGARHLCASQCLHPSVNAPVPKPKA